MRTVCGSSASPLVTVIIPTYNWSAVLPFSVRSALDQTLRDIEVLVIGDGCTDDSGAVVASIDDSRLRWVNLPANTGGQAGPNNEGLRQARGSVIAYLGHDDLWLPQHLALMLEAIAAGSDVAHGICEAVHPDGRVQLVPPHPFRPGRTLPPTSVVHRRAVTDAIGGWKRYTDTRLDPEADLWRRAHRAGFRFGLVPRLTAIKFPAAWRPGVYRTRPCHEQAAWFLRVRQESDFEAVECGRLLETAMQPSVLRTWAYLDLVRAVVAQAGQRIGYRLSARSPYTLGFRKGAGVAWARKVKGVDPEKPS